MSKPARKKVPKIPHVVNDDGTITIGESSSFTRRITLINPTDKLYHVNNRYRREGGAFILWFGACGPTYLHVYADHLQDALDECIDWIVDNAPGLLCDDAVKEAFDEAKAEGKSDDEAWEIAEEDTTSGGNAGNHILSWEWGLLAEHPSGYDLRALAAGVL